MSTSTSRPRLSAAAMGAILVAGIAAPWLLGAWVTQLAFFWLMVVFALTWDVVGGQMGYNSFGNIIFFGLGAYATSLLQRAFPGPASYFPILFSGMGISAGIAVAAAALLGPLILGMRGHYFSIATLGLGVAAADLFAGWDWVGAGSGILPAQYPGSFVARGLFFYYLLFALAAATFLTLRWAYRTRFGLALNAIRDDEDKAEAMGLHTTRYKVAAWMLGAFFLGLAGGPVAGLAGFVDPRDLAFANESFGVWMVLMAILGGKGTLWGPVIGAALFHLAQQLFWKYLFGWQRVALGLLIVVIVVFFPTGLLGWLRERRPRWFGERVEAGEAAEVPAR